jgi:hypothetical protein
VRRSVVWQLLICRSMDGEPKTRAELMQRLEQVSESLRSIGGLPNSLRRRYIDQWNDLAEEREALLVQLEAHPSADGP